MATLLIHFVSDFLRDENLRCRVMEDEEQAYADYGLSTNQKAFLNKVQSGTVTREDLLQEMSREIPPFRYESGAGDPQSVLQYPSGDVVIHEHAVTTNGPRRTVDVSGTGFVSNCTVTFTPSVGNPIPGTVTNRSCDIDAWQRLTIEVTAATGTYTMRIDRGSGVYNEVQVVFP